MNEQQARNHVRKLSRFYTDALIYVIVNLGLILIWAISGGGYFWPIWVIIGWGIGLGVHAFSLGLIPQMNSLAPFMTSEWEDQEVRRILKAGDKSKEKKEKKADKGIAEKISEEIASIQKDVEAVVGKTKKVKGPKLKKAKKTPKTPKPKAPKAPKAPKMPRKPKV